MDFCLLFKVTRNIYYIRTFLLPGRPTFVYLSMTKSSTVFPPNVMWYITARVSLTHTFNRTLQWRIQDVGNEGGGVGGGGRPVVGAGPWGENRQAKKKRSSKNKTKETPLRHRERGALESAGAFATFATRLIRHWGRPSIQVKHVVKHVVGVWPNNEMKFSGWTGGGRPP